MDSVSTNCRNQQVIAVRKHNREMNVVECFTRGKGSVSEHGCAMLGDLFPIRLATVEVMSVGFPIVLVLPRQRIAAAGF